MDETIVLAIHLSMDISQLKGTLHHYYAKGTLTEENYNKLNTLVNDASKIIQSMANPEEQSHADLQARREIWGLADASSKE